MTSLLPFIKRHYFKPAPQQITDKYSSNMQNYQRCGKQFISMMVSSSLIKSQVQPSNRDITASYKRLEQELIRKMRTTKRQAYKLFGQYCLEQLTSTRDQKSLQLQFARMFFKQLDLVTKSKSEPIGNFKKIPYSRQATKSQNFTMTTINNSKIDGMVNVSPQTIRFQPTDTLTFKDKQKQLLNMSKSIFSKQTTISQNQSYQKVSNKGSVSTDVSKSKFTSQSTKQNYYNKSQTVDQDDFNFQLTPKDIQKKNKEFTAEDYFVDVVAYLLKLPSPQGQLTYIKQHLKWQDFQTFFPPFMNDASQWICTARITFPPNMYPEKFMERTEKSKVKKKARQLACMHLLKALYLQHPEVWMLYKHLKQQKRLVIPAADEPKDEQEIALINNWNMFYINEQIVQKLFRHNQTDIRKMMEGISAKAELNTLLQQLPGRVTSPKLQKKPVQGSWLVPVRIEYKSYSDIQNNKPAKIYEKSVMYFNTKIAEEQAYMQAIIEMYQQNPDLFEKVQSIKLAKGIKDSQKKMPLLRTLK